METKYNPSELLIDIYKMFNVTNQTQRIKLLSRKDIYYLLICCMDYHDENQPTVINNYKEFESEIDEIMNFLEKETTTDPDLLELVKETGSTFIEVVDLPRPYTVDEVRELKLNNILDN